MKTLFFPLIFFVLSILYSFKNEINQIYPTQTTTEIDSIVKIAGVQNEFVIDYQFLENNLYLQISKIKKDYYLKTFDANNQIETHLLDIKPTSLFKDASGKIYILTKNKAFHLKLNPFIELDSYYTLDYFDKFIANAIQVKQDYILTQSIDKTTKEYSVFINKKDSPIQKMLNINYLNAISYNAYEQKTRGSKEIYKHAAGYKRYYLDLKNTQVFNNYNVNLRTSPSINIASYTLDSLIYTFDLLNNKLITTNIHSTIQTEYNLELFHENKPQIQLDEFTKEFFISTYEKGSFVVYKVNLNDGTLNEKFILKTHLYPDNIKINDGVIYFTSISEMGFSKLYGARLF